MKLKLLPITISAVFFLAALATVAMAQDEVPAPYAGLENPFPWSDKTAQENGKMMYQSSCLGCHGANGDNIAEYDFSTADFPPDLEARPDHYFWVISEGRLDKGMPPYKSSLSDEQRWQVLTYLWSLGKTEDMPEETPPPAGKPATDKTQPTTEPTIEEISGSLLVIMPEQAQLGRPLLMTAYLRDGQEKPVRGSVVKFFIKVDFFTSGLMEIGEATTNDEGIAVLEYTPQQAGELDIVASYESVETTAMLTVAESAERFYHPEAGIPLPAMGKEVLIGPKSALTLEGEGNAPITAFRLPGGIFSWLTLFVATVMLIWVTYFRVIYQVLRIPIVNEIRDTDTRIIPLAGLAIVLFLGTLLVLMILTGPYSHFNLLR